MTDASGGTVTATADGQQATQNGEQQRQEAQAAPAAQTQTNGQQAAGGEQAPDMSGWPQAAIDAYNRRDTDAKRYQREAGDNRVRAREDAREAGKSEAALAFAQALAPVLGIELPGSQAPSPEQLTQQVQSVSAERDAAIREAATVKAAALAGVDPTKLDYLQFKLSRDPAYTSLDVADPALGAKVKASIDTLVSADATLRLTGTAQASGVESLGGSGGSDEITPERFGRMTIQERQDLYFQDQALYDRLVAAESQR